MIRVVKYPFPPKEGEVVFYVGRNKKERIGEVQHRALSNMFRGPDRTTAIRYYKHWLLHSLEMDKRVINAYTLIRNTAAKYDVALVCHCAPLDCHADVIKDMIDNEYPA